MTLKEFCTILQQCANKLEEEIRININDVHNLIYGNKLTETKMALEKAKDYHYKETIDSVAEILKNVKKIIFHQDKIEWLSEETNFTKDELKRFSYVKRQVFAFSKPEESTPIPSPTIKKEKRRSASEISIGSLEAWEKYLDQKDKEEKEIEEKVAEIKPVVPKRVVSNVRRRKKFVSSTLDGFLEGNGGRRELDSILEDASSTEDNDRVSCYKSLESLDQMTPIHTRNNQIYDRDMKRSKYFSRSLETLHYMACRDDLGSIWNDEKVNNSNKIEEQIAGNVENEETWSLTDKNDSKIEDKIAASEENEERRSLTDSSEDEDKLLTVTSQVNSDIINVLNETKPKDDEAAVTEILNSFLMETPASSVVIDDKISGVEPIKEKTKPRIVDVIYKKKPS